LTPKYLSEWINPLKKLIWLPDRTVIVWRKEKFWTMLSCISKTRWSVNGKSFSQIRSRLKLKAL